MKLDIDRLHNYTLKGRGEGKTVRGLMKVLGEVHFSEVGEEILVITNYYIKIKMLIDLICKLAETQDLIVEKVLHCNVFFKNKGKIRFIAGDDDNKLRGIRHNMIYYIN